MPPDARSAAAAVVASGGAGGVLEGDEEWGKWRSSPLVVLESYTLFHLGWAQEVLALGFPNSKR
jgi:hypothetical protein